MTVWAGQVTAVRECVGTSDALLVPVVLYSPASFLLRDLGSRLVRNKYTSLWFAVSS